MTTEAIALLVAAISAIAALAAMVTMDSLSTGQINDARAEPMIDRPDEVRANIETCVGDHLRTGEESVT